MSTDTCSAQVYLSFQVLVAAAAFAMGLHKMDVRQVIHDGRTGMLFSTSYTVCVNSGSRWPP